jgi:hypothetical protein
MVRIRRSFGDASKEIQCQGFFFYIRTINKLKVECVPKLRRLNQTFNQT